MIYVDSMRWYGNIHSCHMIAIDESLFAFAKRIGAKRYHAGSIRHYDLTEKQRMLAIQYGAQCVTSKELVRLYRDNKGAVV